MLGLTRPQIMNHAARDGSPSLASQLLGPHDGIAIDFSDSYFFSTTGFYGSMRVRDSATPANNYDSAPRSSASSTKITQSGSGFKNVRQADGHLDYQPHNLAVRSDDVGNSSWAKVFTASNPSANVTAATKANPCVVTFSSSHPFVNGQTISFASVGGMTQLNGNVYTVANATSTTVELSGIDSTSYGTYTSGGVGSAATILNLPAVGDRVQQFPSASFCVSRTGIFSAVLSGTGTMSLVIYEGGAVTVQQVTLTSTPTRYYVTREIGDTATDVRLWIERRSGDTATAVTVTDIQFEVSWHRTTPGPYIRTTSAATYTLPLEWDTSGNLIGALIEESRQNVLLRSSDLTNVAWTANNMTTARTATGPNNRANFATTLTATASNATILQAVTRSSIRRFVSCWIKRRTGTGVIEITQDNGTTWTAVTVTSSWTKVWAPAATLANPTCGLRIVTNGDAVDVAFFMNEESTTAVEPSSPIHTVAAGATRPADNYYVTTADFPTITNAATLYAEFFTPVSVSPAQRIAASFGLNTTNHLFVAQRSGIDDFDNRLQVAGSNIAVFSGSSMNISASNKTAIAIATNDGESVGNNEVLGPVDTSCDLSAFTGVQLQIGAPISAINSHLNDHVKAIRLVPVRMSQADMLALCPDGGS